MNLPNQTRVFTFTFAAMLVAMFQFAPTRSWACSTAGATTFTHGAQSDASALTVCVKSVASTKVVTPVKPAQPPAAKPVQPSKPAPVVAPKPSPKPTPPPLAKSSYFTPPKVVFVIPFAPVIPKATPKPSPKPAPKVTSAPVSTPKPTTPAAKLTVSTATAEARFVPEALLVTANDLVPTAGDRVDLAVDAGLHFRSATLLGKAADVSFTPLTTSWSFADGSSATGLSVSHFFSRPGAFEVQAKQSYEASYRIAGETGWVSGGEVTVTGLITINVQRAAQPPAVNPPNQAVSKLVLLVGANCLGREQSFGCQP